MAPDRNADVLVVGAGPTGLVLGLWLTLLGVRMRIIDKTPEPATTSRAVAVQARTLELYRQVALADAVVAGGRKVAAVNLWVAGNQVAHAGLSDMGAGISPFPYALIYPQDDHERLLIDRLAEAGVEVERETEFVAFEETSGRLLVRLKRADGATEACEAAYIAGCDGAHSTVRETFAVGHGKLERCRLLAADVARLAGPRVRSRRTRDPRSVYGADTAASRLSLAPGYWSCGPQARCGLSPAP
jgi:2-polyprenyl-6-methoxyphenol hydroxylase-like FAD-dependent oxidoreductase